MTLMDKKTRNILIIVAAIVVLLPVVLIVMSLGMFIATDAYYSMERSGGLLSGFSLGSTLKFLGVAIIVVGVPLVLFLTRKKK